MGKLIISNNKKIIEKLSKTFLNVGFSENRKYNLPPYITTFYKLNVKNDNVYCQDDFFVIVNGTAIYKNQFGYKALKFLLDDYRQLIKKYSNEEVIRKLREKLIGNYVVVIGSVKSSCCFVDETGSYAFYYSSGSDFLATQTFYHVAKNSSNKINKYAVFEKMIRGNMSAKDTYFDGVTRLLADEILELHFENNGLVVRTVKCNLNDYTCTVIDENEYIEKLKTEIEHLAMMRHALLNNSKTLMFVTGGLDSRLELSLHLKFKEEVILGYWAGNDIITNGTKEDLEISQKIAVAINAPFKFFDV